MRRQRVSSLDQVLRRQFSGDPPFSPSDVLVLAAYWPGMAKDRTRWETWVLSDGRVFQLVYWCPRIHGGKETEYLTSLADESQLSKIVAGLATLDGDDVAELRRSIAVTDAARFTIRSNEPERIVTLPLAVCEILAPSRSLSESAQRGLRAFRHVWDLIEDVAPYTLAEHLGSR